MDNHQHELPLMPPAAAVGYRELLIQLRQRIVGQNELVRRMAFLALRTSAESTGVRIVLLGPPGSGRGHIVRSLSQVLGGPLSVVRLQDLAETNWRGRALGAHLGAAALRPGAVIHLAGLEHLVVRSGTYRGESASTRDYREGKQASLIALFEGGSVALDDDAKRVVDTEGLTVVATGHLPGLPDRPTAEDYTDCGLPVLGEHLASAAHLRAEPLGHTELARLIAEAADGLARQLAWTGHRLSVDPSVIAHVAQAVASGRGTLRDGLAWVLEGLEGRVITLLEAGAFARPDQVWTLALDDLSIPAPARGRWVE
jgi:hypothetical protein